MSRAEKLFEAIGLVDDAYIEEAADARAVRTPSQWQRWGALAATLVLVAGLGLAATTQLRGCGSKSMTADTAAPESGMAQESTTADSASDDVTGGSAEGATGEDMGDGASGGTDNGTALPTDAIGTELAVLTVSDGAWTVDRHTAVEAAGLVTVTDTYLVTNDSDTDQEIEAQIVAPGETVELDMVTTSAETELVLVPVENVTPGVWTVTVTAADGYTVEGLTAGELSWESHTFTVSQPE